MLFHVTLSQLTVASPQWCLITRSLSPPYPTEPHINTLELDWPAWSLVLYKTGLGFSFPFWVNVHLDSNNFHVKARIQLPKWTSPGTASAKQDWMLHKSRRQCNLITNYLNWKQNSLLLKSRLLALTWSVGKVLGCGVSQCWDNEISGVREEIFQAVHGLYEFTNHWGISELLEESTNKNCQGSQTKVTSGISTSLWWVPITVSVCHLGLEGIWPWGVKYVLSNTFGEVLGWLFQAVLTEWD